MGSNFRENLRIELDFQGVIVKELSAKTGIPVATLDCYLRTQSTEPSAENAVKIARALGVSAEYLVTGKAPAEKPQAALSREGRLIIQQLGKLSPDQCRAILSLIRAFKG
ncbi:MAG: helix-turn-helix domain-containing protein [Treponema sp.]|jgi:transcriptional regulator with XRE-family HTH domain|nr:helix-turn-helix domain-containing protein [Treponema sp.]